MAVSEPSWWYDPTATLVPSLLAPAAWAYGAVSGRRMDRAPSYRASLPVICVGNLTAGGTGKTPFTHLVVERLRALGATPVIVTRGHGGTERGPHRVHANDGADRVGDEALLHARLAPTILARDRTAAARMIEQIGGTTHIVLDDGLQNPALAKDLRIVLVDALRGIGNGRVIPAGPLRAPLAAQRQHIDLLVLNDGIDDEHAPDALASVVAKLPRPTVRVRLEPVGGMTWLRGAPVLAYAGIGVPERFFRMLRGLGADVRMARAFRDHEPLSEAQATDLLATADGLGAQLVTTAKDHARLSGASTPSRGGLARLSRVIEVRLTADAQDLAVLDEMLTATRTR